MPAITDNIVNEVKKVIQGKDNIIKMTLATVLAKGHVLLEDIPGVGKTTIARVIAETTKSNFSLKTSSFAKSSDLE